MTRARAGRAVQALAAACLVASLVMAVWSYRGTAAFLAHAGHVPGIVVPDGVDPATLRVRFTAESGRIITFDAPAPSRPLPPGPVPVAYAEGPDGVEARIDIPSLLWARWHGWLVAVLASAFFAVYGHALLTDPLSVIAFKRWR